MCSLDLFPVNVNPLLERCNQYYKKKLNTARSYVTFPFPLHLYDYEHCLLTSFDTPDIL